MTDLAPGLKELLSYYHRVRGPMHVSEIARAVSYLTKMLNHVLPFRPGYLHRGDLRRAYVEYYLPIHVAKVGRVLDEMTRYAGDFLTRPLRLLDYGCGPGTASVAFRLWGGKTSRHVLVDVVEEVFDEAEVLLGATFERAAEPPEGPYDLLFAANVLVEIEDAGRMERLLDSVDPAGYAVIVEPATPEATRRLMEWRDGLFERGWRIAAPCLGIARCPMRPMPDLWCHQDSGWSAPGIVEEIDRRVGLDNARSLKYSYLVATREGATLPNQSTWRVVSNLHRTQGRAWAWLCGQEGDLWRAEALRRDRTKGPGEFFRCKRGDLLHVTGPAYGRLESGHRVERL